MTTDIEAQWVPHDRLTQALRMGWRRCTGPGAVNYHGWHMWRPYSRYRRFRDWLERVVT